MRIKLSHSAVSNCFADTEHARYADHDDVNCGLAADTGEIIQAIGVYIDGGCVEFETTASAVAFAWAILNRCGEVHLAKE